MKGQATLDDAVPVRTQHAVARPTVVVARPTVDVATWLRPAEACVALSPLSTAPAAVHVQFHHSTAKGPPLGRGTGQKPSNGA